MISVWQEIEHGPINDKLNCPHCGGKGGVCSKQVKRKDGLSGGKIMGGLLTGGVSLLATGLSRKHSVTELWCSNCKSVWHI